MRGFICVPFNVLAACVFWVGWGLSHALLFLFFVPVFVLTSPLILLTFDAAVCESYMMQHETEMLKKRNIHIVPLFDAQIRYLFFVCPEENPETLVLLHGENESSFVMLDLAILLSQRYSVLVVDIPGFGRGPTVNSQEPVKDIVTQLGTFCANMGLSSFVLVGHSFGGYLAIHFCASFPTRVKQLILVGPIGVFPGFGTLGAYWIAIYKLHKWPSMAGKWGKIMAHFFLSDDYHWLLASHSTNSSHEIIASMLHLGFSGGCWQETVSHLLSEFQIPVCLIYGQYDSIVPVHQGYALLDHFKFPLNIVENKGHTPFDSPKDAKKVAQIIVEYITEPPQNRRARKSIKMRAQDYPTNFNPMRAQENMMALYPNLVIKS
jgi:pimeloyl-ACP methyl ester carboxylesterase